MASWYSTSAVDAMIAAAKNRANHTGTQPASTVTGLATVALTGNYSDLVGAPAGGGGTGGTGMSFIDNGDGSITITQTAGGTAAFVDNGDGSITIS